MSAVAEWSRAVAETGEECDSIVILRGNLAEPEWKRLGTRVDALLAADVVELRPGQHYLVPPRETLWRRLRYSGPAARLQSFVETSRVAGAILHPLASSPVVIVRRRKMERRERMAFELGREMERHAR